MKFKEESPVYCRIGITGSPGTGKKSVGKLLADKTRLRFLSINEYAIRNHFAKREGTEFVVNMRKLRGKIRTRGRVVVGHLLPYLVSNKDLDLVVVLRCSPSELRRRYFLRGYPEGKIIENIEAELIGLIAEKASREYSEGKLAEFDTTRAKPAAIVRKIENFMAGRRRPTFGKIDWLSASTSSEFSAMLHGTAIDLTHQKG